MADGPSDSQELARQILSGRISIQQLAQEQARRRASGQAQGAIHPAPGQAKASSPYATPPTGSRAPSIRPTSYQQRGQSEPPVPRTVPFPARPAGRAGTAQEAQSQAATRRSRRGGGNAGADQVERQPGRATPIAGGAKAASGGAMAASVKGPSGVGPARPAKAPAAIAIAMLQDQRFLRSAFILTEIFGKPLALRGDHGEF